ncbi:MAG: histidine kinase [Eubacteriales bacterium]|nr:histidine kinase [Eubacteriales bacterium]
MDIRANILVDTIALSITLAVLRGEMKWKERKHAYQKRFFQLLVANCLVLAMDLAAWLCDGQTFANVRTLCYITNTGYYAMQITYCWIWTLFAYDWANDYRQIPRLRQLLFALPMLAEWIALAFNLSTGSVFVMDEANHYRRGAGYWFNLIPFIFYTLTALALLTRSWLASTDANRKRHSLTLLVAMLLPTCGSIIESRSYGLTFTWPLAALSLLLIYLSTQQEQNALDKAEAASMKAELAESRMSIMLSQIQPHFLYNSLSVIAELCETDPATARCATLQFSSFLRGNMSSLTMNKPIAFEHELQHTKNYLALEQLRFPDRLHTMFDIEVTHFQLPTLTLQPIVENAVRYGVTKRPEGGTVAIRTQETPESFIVTVSDDGVGFDPKIPKEDGRTHIGLINVSDRLRRMVGGTLQITSTPGVGTVAVLTLPKGAFPC